PGRRRGRREIVGEVHLGEPFVELRFLLDPLLRLSRARLRFGPNEREHLLRVGPRFVGLTRLERGLLVRVAAPELKAGGAPQVALRARLVLLTMKRLEGRQCALIRLMLERIARLSEGDPGAWYSLRAALLNDVRQLVGEQRVSGGRPRPELIRTE